MFEASRLYQIGLARLQTSHFADAEAHFRQAIAFDDHFAAAYAHLGMALQALGRRDEAVAHLQRALSLQPDDAATLNNFANLLQELDRPAEAVVHYESALRFMPGRADLLVNYANALHASGHHARATEQYSRAIALAPGFARGHMSFGNSLKERGRYSDAVASYERALAIDPAYNAARINLAKTLHMAGRRDDAIACYRKALEVEPGHAEARFNLGGLNLSAGGLAEGWNDLESRWDVLGHGSPRAYPQPLWGGQRVQGLLLVWGEQGLGDQILYSGMLEELREQADGVLCEVEPRLCRLFARSFPDIRFIPLGTEVYQGPLTEHVPIGGLGKYLRPSFDAFPRRTKGYLVADAARADALRRRLSPDGRRLIGLSWISRNPEFGSLRSAALREFAPLLQLQDCRFVDLQYGDTQVERAELEHEIGCRVERLDDIDNTNDIDALAALVSACDGVVTIDNTTAHLAGALGRPTWVLVPHERARIWYWFDGRDDSPWYPHLRVRRQLDAQGWAMPLAQIARELAAGQLP